MQPLHPPVQVGEITGEELKVYDGSDPKKPLLMAIKGQICDVSQSRFVSAWYEGETEDGDYSIRRWEGMDIDILVKIFQLLDLSDRVSGIAHVCSAWRLASCDPLLWKTLDLSMLKSHFIKIQIEPYIYVDERSDKSLTCMKICLNLSRGNITALIFHLNLYISDAQLTHTAERCPRLRRLVMPGWNRIKKVGICKAICCWKNLESLTMPYLANPPYLLQEIATNCRNFSELKIMGSCNMHFAMSLATFLLELKVLSLRCSTLPKDALIYVLDNLRSLEVLNISHCIVTEDAPPPEKCRVLKEIDKSICERASRLRQFLTCMNDTCIICQRMKDDEGILRWYKYEEEFWKADEVKSLAV